MKKIFTLSLLFSITLVTTLTGFAKTNESLDKVVALVNDDVVTQTEFNRALDITKNQIAQQHIDVPDDVALKKQVLDQLINRKIQLQLAKQSGVTVDDKTVNLAIANIAKQNNISPQELFEHLKDEGMSEVDYKKEIRDQMTMRKVQQEQAVKSLSVSQQEVTAFMQSKSWKENVLKEYRLEDTLIPVSDKPSESELSAAKKYALAVLAELNQGKKLSDISNADANQQKFQSGDLGWRKLAEMPPTFALPVSKLKKNEIAGPIQAPNGFHLVRLIDVHVLSSEAAPSRKEVETMLLQRKFDQAVATWVSKMRGQSFIKSELS